jgi:hypothetical protein
MRSDARGLYAGLMLGAALSLTGCAHGSGDAAANPELNAVPANYRSEILAAMHAYLNDPTGVRDAAISEPALKAVGGFQRYVVCLRFNPKKHGKDEAAHGKGDAGHGKEETPPKPKELAAVFMVARFDRFAEQTKETCAGVAYTPFPELEKLTR